MDLGDWLRSLGLEQYEAAFRENAINETLLPSLTAEDLKDLGVVIVGHRRTLLDAIAALRGDPSAKAPPLDAFATIDRSAKDTAERRQVTVIFSDLVGSTPFQSLWAVSPELSSSPGDRLMFSRPAVFVKASVTAGPITSLFCKAVLSLHPNSCFVSSGS